MPKITLTFQDARVGLNQIVSALSHYIKSRGYKVQMGTEGGYATLYVTKGVALWKGRLHIYIGGTSHQFYVIFDSPSAFIAPGGWIGFFLQHSINDFIKDITSYICAYSGAKYTARDERGW